MRGVRLLSYSAGERGIRLGTNKRYGQRLSERAHDRWQNGGRRPVDVPPEAYGPERIRWVKPGVDVWAWIHWDDGTVERIATVANGWNDRVVDVTVPGGFGTVWRSAVTHRVVDDRSPHGRNPASPSRHAVLSDEVVQ